MRHDDITTQNVNSMHRDAISKSLPFLHGIQHDGSNNGSTKRAYYLNEELKAFSES